MTALQGHVGDTLGVSFLSRDDGAARATAPSLLSLRIGVAWFQDAHSPSSAEAEALRREALVPHSESSFCLVRNHRFARFDLDRLQSIAIAERVAISRDGVLEEHERCSCQSEPDLSDFNRGVDGASASVLLFSNVDWLSRTSIVCRDHTYISVCGGHS